MKQRTPVLYTTLASMPAVWLATVAWLCSKVLGADCCWPWCAAGVASTDHHGSINGHYTCICIAIDTRKKQYHERCVAGCSKDVALEMRFDPLE